nr:ABC-type nitrate/sulfonate/bicarbonate transport system, periplasmic component [Aeromicrobium sp.]
MLRGTLTMTAALAAAVLTLGACGGGGDDGPTTEGGKTQLTVGVIPIVDTAPIWLGVEKGFFEDEGIELKLTKTTGGAAAVPGVMNGEFDLAFGNIMSLMVAQDQGLPLKFVANGTTTSGQEGKDFSGVVVPKGSDIASPKDLEGKTVSVNNLKNIGDTTVRYVVEADGGDQSKIKFSEVAFPDAPAALAKGDVDAAWILEPFLSKAVAEGGTVISWNYVETSPQLDIAGYFAKNETIAKDADIIKKFRTAMDKSLEYAQANPDEVRAIVGTYTEIDEPTRAAMVLPKFTPDFDRDAAKLLGDAAVKYGTLEKAPNLDDLLP